MRRRSTTSALLEQARDRFEAAVPLLRESIAIHERRGIRLGLVHALINLGNTYLELHDMKAAAIAYHRALQEADALGRRREAAAAARDLAFAVGALGQVQLRIATFRDAYARAESTAEHERLASRVSNLAEIYRTNGLEREAEALETHALAAPAA